jgi:hypothetical protein
MTQITNKAKWDDPKRDRINFWISLLSVIVGVGSLAYAVCVGQNAPDATKRILVGFWLLAPPIYFWLDWHVLCRNIPSDNTDSVKHIHDLSRNIWVALVVVLIALFNIQVFKP